MPRPIIDIGSRAKAPEAQNALVPGMENNTEYGDFGVSVALVAAMLIAPYLSLRPARVPAHTCCTRVAALLHNAARSALPYVQAGKRRFSTMIKNKQDAYTRPLAHQH
jgi:hypothetical protein